MDQKRSLGFAVAAVAAAAATAATCFGDALGLARSPTGAGNAAVEAPFDTSAHPVDMLQSASPWLLPAPESPRSLRGKVVIVNFWTYSCINSLRALPYLRAWSQRYADKGLAVVGVHAPEFGFEKDPANVRLALDQLDVRYPNLQDNDYAMWRAFANRGWPGIYFIDAQGKVRGYRLGEGGYAEGEQLIRTLLAEAGLDLAHVPQTAIEGAGVEAQADWADLGSPEAYLGYAKAVGFASPGGLNPGAARSYAPAASLSRNRWDLAGIWKVGGEYALLERSPGTIRFRFHARDAHLVLGGAADGRPVRFRVTIDGRAPSASHGVDVDAAGWGEVKQDRLYQLIRQPGEIVDRTLEIQFSRPGVRAYVFTFG
ncbi:redoxin domain-containing protein [Sphingomonas sp. MAH-20]|uniref:Redoxin domain-containing protein n=1 Tax=Sphingomonas horti TaxID=2682842 RepID=A0A6I4IY17_9SPHN|nr:MULTISPECIES: redoxin domain-containing protein [Sphingomonas]MBA2920847.1 redoxin domain-containing protein [Sphingomonas sp. CGMCC 1.13658]MVO76833.1 redoxin domain-containing protein [Sphingomonas horti]